MSQKGEGGAMAGLRLMVSVALMALAVASARAEELQIATVNNAHMLTLQRLSTVFEKDNPGVRLRWVTLEEGRLRQAVSVDVATAAGRFDVVTLGSLEAPVWGRKGWLVPIPDDTQYQMDDLLPPIRQALSVDGRLMAAPFYGESSMTLYRTDLLRRAGASLPAQPTWEQVRAVAAKVHDPRNGVYGVCLRGKPGWGENMTLISTLVNSWGGQWFDMKWRPAIDTPAWKAAVGFYIDLLRRYGPPSAVANGYNENLALFEAGRCAMWVDATVAASTLLARDPALVSNLGWAHAPVADSPKGSRWLWSWALAVPKGSRHGEAAMRFVKWATSRQYLQLVAGREGWAAVPPGTRLSTYAEPAYLHAHPAATVELQAIQGANPADATVPPSPYVGVQLAGIPEFQSIGTVTGQQISAALTGQITLEAALAQAQAAAEQKMRQAGYFR